MAAARLSAPLDDGSRLALLRAISEQPRRETDDLDRLAAEATPILDAVADRKPYEQGYAMALWLRGVFENPDQPLDPARLLAQWGVCVEDLPEQLARELDAVACWSGEHGPAVLVNPSGRHARSEGGRRATLAHELGHLLLDRRRQLPAAEVFGGSTPLHLEQRARAFAAELLLPREVAGRFIAKHVDVDEAAAEMQRRYGVSREVVGWQIRHGSGWKLLSDRDKRRVTAWCSPWRSQSWKRK